MSSNGAAESKFVGIVNNTLELFSAHDIKENKAKC